MSNVTGCSTDTFQTSQEIADYVDSDGTPNGYYDNVKGQVTGTRVKVLDGVTTNWVNTISYYDDRYRPIQSHQSLYPTGTSVVSTQYDFTGNILATRETQTNGSNSTEVNTCFTYDHANRLLETRMQVDQEDPFLLAQNVYNEHGELIEKNLHSDDDATLTQSIEYQYNIRGWLTSINDPEELMPNQDLFGMKLFYDDPGPIPGANSHYNGNISGIQWGEDESLDTKAYSYGYDIMNRIRFSNYSTNENDTWTTSDNYDTEYYYDLNGNILSLERRNDNGETIDDLDYDYNGNQLIKVEDASVLSYGFTDGASLTTEYEYDGNGNMLTDSNKGIEVEYNFLNLPAEVRTADLSNNDEISYIYDATGTKWLKTVSNNTALNQMTMYAGSFIYEDNNNNGSNDFDLDYILHAEGKIETTGTTVNEYQYFLKDHLGNTRVVFNENGEILQESAYYPFGMTFSNALGGENKYLYNGKELQDEQLGGVNLDWYDYGARFYDPALKRWIFSANPKMELAKL